VTVHSIIHFHAEKQCVFEIRYWGNDSAKKALCSATLAKGTQVKYPALPTNVTVLIFSETHKIRSPEAMTRLMNLLIPDSWKNMRRSHGHMTVVGRHAMILTKRNRMRRKLKEATRLTQVSILKTWQKSDRRVCLDRQTPKSTSAQNVIKL